MLLIHDPTTGLDLRVPVVSRGHLDMENVASRRTVLVTGAAGAMGSRLVAQLQSKGWIVRAMVLPNDADARSLPKGVEIAEADITNASTLPGCLLGVGAVLHLAGVVLHRDEKVFREVNEKGTWNLVQACRKAGIRRFVHVSSASVDYPNLTAYGTSKRCAEDAVRASGLDWTIVRPTLLVGAQGGREYQIFRRWVLTLPFLLLPAGGKALKQPVHEDDLAEGLCQLLEPSHSKSVRSVYHMAGREVMTLREFAQIIAMDHGRWPRWVVPVPVIVAKRITWLLDKLGKGKFLYSQALAGLIEDAEFDIQSAVYDFGYRPRTIRGRLQRSESCTMVTK